MTEPDPFAGTQDPFAGSQDIGADPFDNPAPQAERPRVRDIHGRLLLIMPLSIEKGVPNRLRPGTKQDRMTADLIVLDGGTLHYGGAPEKIPPVPHTKHVEIGDGFKIEGLFISQVGLLSQCRQALANKLSENGGNTMVLGRLTVGQATGGNNPPYLLNPPTDADKALARKYLAAHPPTDPFA